MKFFGRFAGLLVLSSLCVLGGCSNQEHGKLSITLQMPDPDLKTPFLGCLRDRRDDLLECGIEIACKNQIPSKLAQCRKENKGRIISTMQ